MAADSEYRLHRLHLDPNARVEIAFVPATLPDLQRALDDDGGIAVLLQNPTQPLTCEAFESALVHAAEPTCASDIPVLFLHPGADLQPFAATLLGRQRPPAILLVDHEQMPVLDARARARLSALLGLRQAPPEPIVTPTAPDTPAVADRDALLASERWSSSTEVAKRARAGTVLESNPHQYASRLRREGRLFGVRFKGAYLHPDFQFLPATGEPHPRLPELLALLPDEDHGWAAAFWLFAPTRLLDGARPADVFLDRPEAVIAAARRAFEGDDADW